MYEKPIYVYVFFPALNTHSPQMSNFPETGQFRRDSGCQAESMVVYVHASGSCGDFRFGWGGTHQYQVLHVLAQVVGNLHLPLNEPFPRVKGQHNGHVLAQNGDSVGLFVQRKPGFHAQKLLQGERRLCLSMFVAVLGVTVQLQVETIWKERSERLLFVCVHSFERKIELGSRKAIGK